MSTPAEYASYVGLVAAPVVTPWPLEFESVRRVNQALMDGDPLDLDPVHAAGTRFGGLVAPPLYPMSAFRPPVDRPDPLASLEQDPDCDASPGTESLLFALPQIPSPFKRLLGGGSEIEFYRCLALGERCVAQARYADIQLKRGKSGEMLVVTVETSFRTEPGELLLLARQKLIWR